MRERTITLTEAQQALESLCEQFSADCPAIVITRDEQPILTVMPYQTHQEMLANIESLHQTRQEMLANIESLQTMLEIMLGSEGTATSHQEKAEIEAGKSISWEEFQKEVGWD
jgi:PHD/YefM family antitoxin component YafN of YafNO toxin-antitoxin module